MNILGTSDKSNVAAVVGENTSKDIGTAPGGGDGVFGIGHGANGRGVVGTSEQQNGVTGISSSGNGVWGKSTVSGTGVSGHSVSGPGVYGHSKNQAGVVGESDLFDGVYGMANANGKAGITGKTTNPNGLGLAGFFDGGDVVVNKNIICYGDVQCPDGADCAEDFNMGTERLLEPGTVVVLGEEGALFPSSDAYDKRVAGVISGAGEYRPAIILDRQRTDSNRQPVALLGKVFCKVDAEFGAIEVGDLLTTSPRQGHAMKVQDPTRAFGSVIGKALRSLSAGRDLIPILISLQ